MLVNQPTPFAAYSIEIRRLVSGILASTLALLAGLGAGWLTWLNYANDVEGEWADFGAFLFAIALGSLIVLVTFPTVLAVLLRRFRTPHAGWTAALTMLVALTAGAAVIALPCGLLATPLVCGLATPLSGMVVDFFSAERTSRQQVTA